MINDYALTLDVDWAPDWCIDTISQILVEKNIKATWFITHDTPAIRNLSEYPDIFELGIHPNFLTDSTQGRNPSDVLRSLLKVIPSAVSVRTHGLVQSSNLMIMMRDEFNLLYDVSIFLNGTPHIEPHVFYTPHKKPLIRLPFFWEEDTEMYSPNPDFSFSNERYHLPGLKIFNFHVIHLILNSSSVDNYQECKKLYPQIHMLPKEVAGAFVNQGPGAYTFFEELIDHMTNRQSRGYTISEIGEKWLNKKL